MDQMLRIFPVSYSIIANLRREYINPTADLQKQNLLR